jgi:hypothetical protein
MYGGAELNSYEYFLYHNLFSRVSGNVNRVETGGRCGQFLVIPLFAIDLYGHAEIA